MGNFIRMQKNWKKKKRNKSWFDATYTPLMMGTSLHLIVVNFWPPTDFWWPRRCGNGKCGNVWEWEVLYRMRGGRGFADDDDNGDNVRAFQFICIFSNFSTHLKMNWWMVEFARQSKIHSFVHFILFYGPWLYIFLKQTRYNFFFLEKI